MSITKIVGPVGPEFIELPEVDSVSLEDSVVRGIRDLMGSANPESAIAHLESILSEYYIDPDNNMRWKEDIAVIREALVKK